MVTESQLYIKQIWDGQSDSMLPILHTLLPTPQAVYRVDSYLQQKVVVLFWVEVAKA